MGSAREQARIRIDGAGTLEIIDPSLADLDLLSEIDPAFAIRSEPLPGFVSPRFLTQRATGTGLRTLDLADLPTESLWQAHAAPTRETAAAGEAGRLELKIELARRILSSCVLCAHRCGVDRHRGPTGRCRLGAGAVVANHFVHIAEEPPINPSYVLNLAGCGLRCRYCQQGDLLDPPRLAGAPLDASRWQVMDWPQARSLSFVGGNPDESLYAILRFLQAAPANFPLPVVWNSHAYSSPETLSLLDSVVDAYVPDWKYDNERCAFRWSGIRGYPEVVQSSVAEMAEQGVPVLIRILVLPGHVECCHLPALRRIASLRRANIRVYVRGQYCPDWRIGPRDGLLNERPTVDEIRAVREAAASLCLADRETIDCGRREISRRD